MRPLAQIVAAVVVAWGCAAMVSAQESNFSPSAPAALPNGWTLVPSLVYSVGYDDNALMRGEGDDVSGDVLNVVNPRGEVMFNGRRGQFDASYDGAFLMYRTLDTLDSYDQHASVSGHRRVSKKITLFGNNNLALVPTTEFVELVALPFIRTGSKIDDASGGIEAALSKYTTLTATMHLQWVAFDDEPGVLLLGGHSAGASVAAKHQLSARTSLTSDFDYTHAVVTEGLRSFDIENATVGLERRLTETFRAFGAIGIAHLSGSIVGPARNGPAYRAGLAGQVQRASLNLEYNRSFVPSYGFGGTSDNEELTFRVQLPLSRNLYTHSAVAWRRNEPLTIGDLGLRSWWVEGAVGYSVQSWVHIEGFYSGTHQSIDRAGGIADRNRFGVQVVTSRPTRIR